MKIALVYDWIHAIGGAERILIILHKLFPKAPIYTSVYDSKNALWASSLEIRSSFLQHIPYAKKHHEWFPLLTPIAFEQFDFKDFDVVISITSADAKGIITSTKTFHFCYMLTPTRYIWSHYDTYLSNNVVWYLSKPFVSYLRLWDLTAKSRPDFVVSISKTVQKRIEKYYKIQSDVIYPPVNIQDTRGKKTIHTKDYYLVVSRLVPYKRIDLIIKACNKTLNNLVIIGEGRSYEYLKSIAGPTIEFKKNVSDGVLVSYYKHAKALVLASEEDFGITPVEAQSYGVPVIAFGKGGVLETVIKGKTGIFFEKQTVLDIINAFTTFDKVKIDAKICKKNASQFSDKRFEKEFLKTLDFQYKRFFRIIQKS